MNFNTNYGNQNFGNSWQTNQWQSYQWQPYQPIQFAPIQPIEFKPGVIDGVIDGVLDAPSDRLWNEKFRTISARATFATASTAAGYLGTKSWATKFVENKLGSTTAFNTVKSHADNLLTNKLKIKGLGRFSNATHWDFIWDAKTNLLEGDFQGFAYNVAHEYTETKAMGLVDKGYRFVGGEKLNSWVGKGFDKGLDKLANKGGFYEKSAKFFRTITDINSSTTTTSTAANSADDLARAAANSADDAANVLARAAQAANATTTQTRVALQSTSALSNCAAVADKVKILLQSPAVKFCSKALAPLAPALEAVDGVSKITNANQALENRENLSQEEIAQLESQRAEGITKTAIGGGALAVGTGLLLASNPVGWTVMAGAGIYALADWGSQELFGKSISSAIGDGVSSAYNAVKEDPSKLLYLTPVAPFKAAYDAYNYFFGDNEEQKNKAATAGSSLAIKKTPSPQINLLKTLNLNPEKDKNKYSYEINNDVLKIQLEVNKKIKEANKDLPRELDLKTLNCDGKLGKQTLLKMHELGLEDEALKLTGLKKQAYNELIDLAKKSQYSNDPKEKEEATKLADMHMKRINSKENYGKVYSANDLSVALNSIKDKKLNPQAIKARIEKSKTEINNNKFKGNFDVSALIPESMRNIPAESTAVNIPLSYVEREFSGNLAIRNPANFTRNS